MLTGKKILVIDDSKTIRNIISKILINAGCQVHTAISGLDAIEKLPGLCPDLICTDVDMPHMDGYEFCKYIRSGEDPSIPAEVSKIPIVVITANDTYGTREKWFEFGAAEFIVKPFEADELISTLERIFIPDVSVKNLTVLIAEDSTTLRNMFAGIISHLGVNVLTVENGQQALKIIKNPKKHIDLLLTDYEMPEMDGFELCKSARIEGFHQPIVFLTSVSDKNKIIDAYNHGATDYLLKPFLKDELLARIKVHLVNQALYKDQKQHAEMLESKLVSRNKDLLENKISVLHTMSSLIEHRDNETGRHTLRTQKYIELMLNELVKLPEYEAQLGLDDITDIIQAAPLHDIGKIAISDAILLKPGKLTDEEFEIMKCHALHGEKALSQGKKNSFMNRAAEIAGSHHEKWDGTGYPRGLSGDDIPISGRLMALADVYDALRTERPYKKAMPHGKAKKIILAGRGGHFDPLIADIFVKLEDEFQLVATQLAD